MIPYYERFLARFPDVAALAAAPVEDVMALWSGLGYYARARNLHRAARWSWTRTAATFPAAPRRSPGCPASVAPPPAIAAFAWGERAAILDGNVKRVLCRVFGIEGFPGDKAVETRLWTLAESLLPERGSAATSRRRWISAPRCNLRRRPPARAVPSTTTASPVATGAWSPRLPTARPKKRCRGVARAVR